MLTRKPVVDSENILFMTVSMAISEISVHTTGQALGNILRLTLKLIDLKTTDTKICPLLNLLATFDF